MSFTLMQSTLRIVSLSAADSRDRKNPFGKTIAKKFGRCLEQAGYPVDLEFLEATQGTPREGLALVREMPQSADVALVNFGPTCTIKEYRRDVEAIIEALRASNPEAWIILWGTPPVPNDHKRNVECLLYNAELHDIANYEQVSYFPTKLIAESLSATDVSQDDAELQDMIAGGIATGLAHAYLSQLQHTVA